MKRPLPDVVEECRREPTDETWSPPSTVSFDDALDEARELEREKAEARNVNYATPDEPTSVEAAPKASSLEEESSPPPIPEDARRTPTPTPPIDAVRPKSRSRSSASSHPERTPVPTPVKDDSGPPSDRSASRPKTGLVARPERADTPTSGDDPPESSSNVTMLVSLTLVAFICVGLAISIFLSDGQLNRAFSRSISTAIDTLTSDSTSTLNVSSTHAIGAAIDRARRSIADAADVRTSERNVQIRAAERLANAGKHREAARIYEHLWSNSDKTAAQAEKYVRVLLKANRFRRAREISVEGYQTGQRSETFETLFHTSLQDDQALSEYDVLELGEDKKIRSIGSASKIDSDAYLLIDGNGDKFLFSPQKSEAARWRDDVAAWRLCRVIECQFELPVTEAARISRRRLERDFNAGESAGSVIDPSAVDWRTETATDGETREYLYGSLRKVPGELARWPIEETKVWRRWLWVYDGETGVLEESLDEATESFRDIADGGLRDGVLDAAGDADVRALARQMSGIIAFDFLTNNWGRFRDDEADYGAANHFADGRFVTIRTDTVFQQRKSTRVEGRFKWATRFSRDTVTSVRMLDRQLVSPLLYPNPSESEKHKLDIFWEQRRDLLTRIDDLADEQGDNDVFAFE